MPYIKQESRKQYDPTVDQLVEQLTFNGVPSGEVNYVISTLIWKLWDKTPSYTSANNLIGALHCVITEFERRKLAPYEDIKIKENGDIC